MTNFVNALKNEKAVTENGMVTNVTSSDYNVDLFFKIGALRKQDPINDFTKAFGENADIATRIALYARDIRSGMGERDVFRNIFKHMANFHIDFARRVMVKVPELGRWDDLFVLFGTPLEAEMVQIVKEGLEANNGLLAKWMPRKGEYSIKFRNAFGWTPKFYRKRLVELTNVVETLMCSGKWNEVDYNKIPSVAASRYRKAFAKHDATRYAEYTEKLVSGDKSVKVNAGAIFPYDVLRESISSYYLNTTSAQHTIAQWNALPNYVGDASILPVVDVSGSMTSPKIAGDLNPLAIAISLGLYLSEKNTGPFKDAFVTFSIKPEIQILKGNVLERMAQMKKSDWAMNTNLNAVFEKILSLSVQNNVSENDMPKYILILSDMQFDQCVQHNDSAIEMIRRKYEAAGYQMPNVIFWNIASKNGVPVKMDANKTALVSGFSPSIVKAILSADPKKFSPIGVMMEAISNPRYDY